MKARERCAIGRLVEINIFIHHVLTRYLTEEQVSAQDLEGSRKEVDIDPVHGKFIMN